MTSGRRYTHICVIFFTLLFCYTSANNTIPKQNGAQSAYHKFKSEEEALLFQNIEGSEQQIQNEDLVITLSRSWWKASKFIILKSHEQDYDVSLTVRSMVGEIMKNGEELLRLLDKKHDDVAVMSPAFQWAQSLNNIYLNIKFAYRWNSPGALSIEMESFTTNGTHFEFSGIGSHSGFKKKYVLLLELFDNVVVEPLTWKFASVGKAQVTIQKSKSMIWEHLIKDKKKIPNMSTWWDLQEKLDMEVDSSSNFDTFPTPEQSPPSTNFTSSSINTTKNTPKENQDKDEF